MKMAHSTVWLYRRMVSFLMIQSAIVILGIGHSETGLAQSVGFMPGDAFFVFAFSEDVVKSLPEKGGDVKLDYAKPEYPFGKFYAGFDRIRLDNVDPGLIQNLRRVYRDHRKYVPRIVEIGSGKDGAKWESELNAPLAFVYNREVDWHGQQRIALKYNKDWPHLAPGGIFGAGPEVAFHTFRRYVPTACQNLRCSGGGLARRWTIQGT